MIDKYIVDLYNENIFRNTKLSFILWNNQESEYPIIIERSKLSFFFILDRRFEWVVNGIYTLINESAINKGG